MTCTHSSVGIHYFIYYCLEFEPQLAVAVAAMATVEVVADKKNSCAT